MFKRMECVFSLCSSLFGFRITLLKFMTAVFFRIVFYLYIYLFFRSFEPFFLFIVDLQRNRADYFFGQLCFCYYSIYEYDIIALITPPACSVLFLTFLRWLPCCLRLSSAIRCQYYEPCCAPSTVLVMVSLETFRKYSSSF